MGQTPKRRSLRPVTKSGRRPGEKAVRKTTSKLDQVVGALGAAKGATLTQLMKLTGWQMHSIRGALAGALKKKRGFHIISEKSGEERTYRIVKP